MKIGNLELENNIFLAPMAGITDLPFRLICKKYGPGLVCTEMVSSKGLMYNDEKTKLLLHSVPDERPVAVQIFGSDVEAMKCAAEKVSEVADIIDINMGCPAPKVVKNGDGSKLLLNLELVEEIVKGVVKSSKVPVTVKIRLGWDSEHVVAVEAAKIIEEAGARYNIGKDESIQDVINKLTDEMLKYAAAMEFEKAAELRDQIKELESGL